MCELLRCWPIFLIAVGALVSVLHMSHGGLLFTSGGYKRESGAVRTGMEEARAARDKLAVEKKALQEELLDLKHGDNHEPVESSTSGDEEEEKEEED